MRARNNGDLLLRFLSGPGWCVKLPGTSEKCITIPLRVKHCLRYLAVSDYAMPLEPLADDFRVALSPVLLELCFAYGLFAREEDGDFDEI